MPVTLSIVQGIGATELLIVLAIVLVFLGPKRLPGLGRQLGAGMRELKDSFARRQRDHDEPAGGDPDDPPRPPAELSAGDR
jgi:sec-independent protein translocase protein TatA